MKAKRFNTWLKHAIISHRRKKVTTHTAATVSSGRAPAAGRRFEREMVHGPALHTPSFSGDVIGGGGTACVDVESDKGNSSGLDYVVFSWVGGHRPNY